MRRATVVSTEKSEHRTEEIAVWIFIIIIIGNTYVLYSNFTIIAN